MDRGREFKIRQFVKEDWRDFRDIRLEALKLHPEFFCPSRDETQFKEADWKERLGNTNGASFGLYLGESIVGLTGIIRADNNQKSTTAHLVASYIRSEYRRQGLTKLFYQARISWAQEQKDIVAIVVEHREDNFPSKAAHQNFSFKFVESRDQKWPDGSTKACHIYQLEL
ncbi:MAG: GNAT family N-acetyltransferase [Halobacteriovoraceae bacterium]|mgnify:CR=1 FL=1|jgi:RimJ/RimL family protein N-acetyltransferase|nr:GNAT family N-acetyltransferase [Halobacteriovoraceae bacterium]MBT5095655.1 GNAT family N-acetyltransferase [Halobacteriovoraceae bacterium]